MWFILCSAAIILLTVLPYFWDPPYIKEETETNEEECKGCTLEDLQPHKIIFKDRSNDGFLLNYSINPEVDGHLVVQPLFHVNQISDLDKEQAHRLIEIIWAASKALNETFSPEKIYVYSFNEAKGYHFHVHVKPKSEGLQVKGARFTDWNDPKLEERSPNDSIEIEKKIVQKLQDCRHIRELHRHAKSPLNSSK